MDFEKLLAEINSNISGLGDKGKATEEQIRSIMAKMEDIESRISQFQAERKMGFTGHHPFQSAEKAEAEAFLRFFKAAMRHDEKELKALNTEEDAEGGILVPEEFRPRIVRIIEQYGMARQLGTRIPMTTDKLIMPTLESGVHVYWGGGSSQDATLGGQKWQGLGANGIPESEPTFGTTTLTIDELYCLVPIANQLIDDAVLDIVNLIVTLIGEAMAKEEDRVAFMGDETLNDPFTGIMEAAANVITIGGALYTDLLSDDLADMIDVIDGDDANCRYIMHATVFNVIRKLKDKQDNYIWQPPTTEGPGTIWGYPYTKIRSLPSVADVTHDKPFIAFGDMRNLYIPDRQQLRIASSTHIGFKKNQTYIRAHERLGFKVALPKTLAVLQTTAATTTSTT